MISPQTHSDKEVAASLYGPDDKNPGVAHDAMDVETATMSTTNCDASQSSSDHEDGELHGYNNEVHRLRALVAHHKSRATKLETENTTLRLDLANVRFDLEHCRLELRQMTTKRDDALNSKATLAQNLGRENYEMILTIDKLETERDVLLEEVDKLRAWILQNKGEDDDDIIEEGTWVATNAKQNNVFRNTAATASIGVIGQPLKGTDAPSTSQDEIRAWETTLISQFPSTPTVSTKPNGDGIFASGEESTSTPLTAADTFDSTEDRLYSDEYLSLVDEEENANDDEDDDDKSFQRSYHGTTKANQNTGQDDSTIGSADTTEIADEDEGGSHVKRGGKKRWGVSVKPRRHIFGSSKAPNSPNCVSQA